MLYDTLSYLSVSLNDKHKYYMSFEFFVINKQKYMTKAIELLLLLLLLTAFEPSAFRR